MSWYINFTPLEMQDLQIVSFTIFDTWTEKWSVISFPTYSFKCMKESYNSILIFVREKYNLMSLFKFWAQFFKASLA